MNVLPTLTTAALAVRHQVTVVPYRAWSSVTFSYPPAVVTVTEQRERLDLTTWQTRRNLAPN